MDPYDLRALFRFRELVAGLPDEPLLTTVSPPPPAARIAILPGSFNPVTSAHLLLAERALGDGYDGVVFLLSRTPAGKIVSGLGLEDRLLTLFEVAPAASGVAITSASLYCDQAAAAAAAFPGAEVAFLAGSDKVVQIFDESWYGDRDEALDRLFARARLVAAPRGEGPERIRALLAQPANRRYAAGVEIMLLHPAVGDLSSTRVRGLLASGADPSGLVPHAVAAFCDEVRAFQPPDPDTGADAYQIRLRLLDALHRAGQAGADFARLVRAALRATPEAARVRGALLRGRAGPPELAELASMAR